MCSLGAGDGATELERCMEEKMTVKELSVGGQEGRHCLEREREGGREKGGGGRLVVAAGGGGSSLAW